MSYINDSREAKIGDVGEDIVDQRITDDWKYFVYSAPNGVHPIDRVAIGFNKTPFFYEVKTKPHMNWGATGFNITSFENYKKINRPEMPVYVFFVDSVTGTVYGNTLDELQKEVKKGKFSFPRIIFNGKIIVFPLENMNTYWKLTKEEISRINTLRNG